MDLLKRENFASGAPFEDKAGYSRAVKVGNMVFCRRQVEGPGDAYLQTKIILQKIEAVLKRAGAKMSHVVRVRFYVTDISRGQDYIRAYSEWFKNIRPVITMAEIKALARPDHLVEIEVDAVMGSYLTSRLT